MFYILHKTWSKSESREEREKEENVQDFSPWKWHEKWVENCRLRECNECEELSAMKKELLEGRRKKICVFKQVSCFDWEKFENKEKIYKKRENLIKALFRAFGSFPNHEILKFEAGIWNYQEFIMKFVFFFNFTIFINIWKTGKLKCQSIHDDTNRIRKQTEAWQHSIFIQLNQYHPN